jgi:hypothetical protein
MKATWEECPQTGGGYGRDNEIFVDPKQNRERARLVAVHEVLDSHFQGRVKHSRLDRAAIDIIDSLIQLNLIQP